MRIVWTTEALSDFENILAYYLQKAGTATAEAVERRTVSQIEMLRDFPERVRVRVRASDRIPGTGEAVMYRLPYIAFIRIAGDAIQVLNIAHTARKFPE